MERSYEGERWQWQTLSQLIINITKEPSLGKRIYFLGIYHAAESSGLEAEQNPLTHRFRLDC